MTKVKLLGIALVVLVLLNIGTLAMLFSGRLGHHGPPRGEGPKAIIIERLHFNAQQVKTYEGLIKKHMESIQAKDKAMMATRSALYHEIAEPNRATRDSLLSVIATGQWDIEDTHLEHFGEIRALCRPDQRADFDALVADLAAYFSHPAIGPPPSRRK